MIYYKQKERCPMKLGMICLIVMTFQLWLAYEIIVFCLSI